LLVVNDGSSQFKLSVQPGGNISPAIQARSLLHNYTKQPPGDPQTFVAQGSSFHGHNAVFSSPKRTATAAEDEGTKIL
jgi:hypothetical protein